MSAARRPFRDRASAAVLEIISSRHPGLQARTLRCGLWCLKLPYALAIAARNWRFDHVPSAISHVAAPVISVGNLTTGGTGKTPLVAYIARWLSDRQLRVALISRGYGAHAGAVNDEARQLEQQLPGVPHVQQRDRVAAAQHAIEALRAQVVVLDDAFQHRRIHRDLDIVLLDALEPFGWNHVLPRGLLREPRTALRRAHAVGLSRADLVDAQRRADIRRQIAHYAPGALLFEVAHRPTALLAHDGTRTPVATIQGQRILAFCGLGNPEGFRQSLQRLDCRCIDFRTYPDHHRYDEFDVAELCKWALHHARTTMPPCAVICTHKDLVKLPYAQLDSLPLRALAIDIAFLSGQQAFEQLLARAISPFMPGRGPESPGPP